MKKNINYTLLALILAFASGSVLANTSDYFKIYAKNITPTYTNETIQVEDTAEEQQSIQQSIVEIQTQSATQNVLKTIDKLDGRVTETATPKTHFGQSINDYEAQLKLEEIGRVLIQKSNLPKPVTFIFSSDNTINAYAEITGKITVFRGLLDYCEDEAELAFVIGHELSHIQNNDSLKQNIANNTIAIGGAIGSKYAKSKISSKISNGLNAFGINANDVTDLAVGTVQQASSSKYSRMHESRADQCSIDYIVKNGYNPLAGISIMFKIGDNYEDLFEDHPSTEKRLQNMYNYIAKKYPQYIVKGYETEAYQNALKNIEK